MNKVDMWPPPENWHPIIVKWDDILADSRIDINGLLEWLKTAPGGVYHLHGWNSTEGFEFRFKDEKDALYFSLMWL